MGGLIFGIIIVAIVISKIRELANEQAALRDRSSSSRPGLGEAPGGEDRSFSLDQVLAEIQRVKEQADRGMAPTFGAPRQGRRVDRKALAERAEARRRATAAQRAVEDQAQGPMGRPATVKLESDASPEDEDAPVAAAPPPAAGVPAVTGAQPAARKSQMSIRDAAIWREILSPPVSMRDD